MATIHHITPNLAKLHAKLEAEAARRSPVYCPAVELDALGDRSHRRRGRRGQSR